MFSFAGIKCPVCSKFIQADDVECHLVMCLTKPRVSYNGKLYWVGSATPCSYLLSWTVQSSTPSPSGSLSSGCFTGRVIGGPVELSIRSSYAKNETNWRSVVNDLQFDAAVGHVTRSE